MKEKELKALNSQAIKDGLMLPNGKSLRSDYSEVLGESLSKLESKLYDLLQSSLVPLPTQLLY